MRDIYYYPKGATQALKYTVDDIDAESAVLHHPDEYSFDPPQGAKEALNMTPAFVVDEETEYGAQAPRLPDYEYPPVAERAVSSHPIAPPQKGTPKG